MQVTIGLYHVLGKMLKREQFLSVTTVGYSAVIFGCALLLLCSWFSTPHNTKRLLHITVQKNMQCLMSIDSDYSF